MLALRNLYAREPGTMEQVTDALLHPTRKSIGGIIVLILIAAGLYVMLPEIRRYVRLVRM